MSRKANGQGHTYKVGNSYRTVIRRGDHLITAMGPTSQESRKRAKAKLEKLPNVLNSKTSIPVARLTLGLFLDEWLANEHQQHIAHTTYKRYASLSRNHIVPCIGSVELQKVTPVDIQRVLTTMREAGQSPRSQQQARALLSIALGAAVNKDYIAINPVLKVRNPINRSKEMHPLTAEEVKRLLETYRGTYMSARLHIALLCGLRQGEALGLRWHDIDLKAGLIQVRVQVQTINGKRDFIGLKTDRSQRTVVLTQSTLETLAMHKSIISELKAKAGSTWQDLDLLFPEINGQAKSSTIDYQEWKRALRLCGIKPRRLHDARHTAATLLYSQGVGIEVISRALGHSSSAITSKLYVHSAIQPLRLAAEKMQELMIDMG
jgi:integrase